jgi:hypothetical protein
LQLSAWVAPPNHGSLKRRPLLWHSRAGGGAVHSINCGPMTVPRSARLKAGLEYVLLLT